jgi:hypothetical protein
VVDYATEKIGEFKIALEGSKMTYAGSINTVHMHHSTTIMSHIIEIRPYILVNLSVNLQSLDPPQIRGNAYTIYIG